jgi:hypothetical protein
MDYINMPLNEHTRDYVSALLSAAILRAVLPRLLPREVDAVWTVVPKRK